jgi:hypothetical protein
LRSSSGCAREALSDPFDQSILSQIVEIEAEDAILPSRDELEEGWRRSFMAMPRCYLP